MSIDPRQKDLWLREFQLNGFVILRDFLPVELVTQMHEELAPLLEAEYEKAKQDGFSKGRNFGRLALHVGPYADMLRGALADERYRSNPVIHELIDAILGEGKWKRGWTVAECVWRGAEFMSWHSDQTVEDTPNPDGTHEAVRVTYNIPLVDFTWSSGPIELLPGSHHLPRSFSASSDIREVPNVYWVQPQLRLGDTILRDGNTLHRGTPNLSDHVRPMLDQTYRAKDHA